MLVSANWIYSINDKSISKGSSTCFKWLDSKEPALHLQSTFIMHCHCEKNHNVYPHNVMFPFGIGSSGTDQKLFQKEENQNI